MCILWRASQTPYPSLSCETLLMLEPVLICKHTRTAQQILHSTDARTYTCFNASMLHPSSRLTQTQVGFPSKQSWPVFGGVTKAKYKSPLHGTDVTSCFTDRARTLSHKKEIADSVGWDNRPCRESWEQTQTRFFSISN